MLSKKDNTYPLISTPLPPFGTTENKPNNDPAQVISIMKSTNFCEILSLLYGILMHEMDNNNNNNPTITENNSPLTLHEKTVVIVNTSMILLNTIAILDLDTFQVGRRSSLSVSVHLHLLDDSW